MYSVDELRSWVERSINTLPLTGKPRELYLPVSYMMSIGGKRIRPLLSLLSYNMFSERIDDRIVLPALGLEVFHGFTLLHDDIMDNAGIRRGQDTVWKKWNSNVAILSGDVMCIMAYQYLCEADPAYQPDVLKLFGRTAAQVCEGQQLDMNYEQLPFITIEDYLEMIALKTAVLLAASAQIGAIAAGASNSDAEKMYEFGYRLGMAFQLQDDLLDAYGKSAVFGKAIGNDMLTNKKTFLLVTALREAGEEDRRSLNAWLAAKDAVPEEKIRGMLDIYDRLGIRAKTEEAITLYFSQAADILRSLDIDPKRKEQLSNFAHELINRDK